MKGARAPPRRQHLVAIQGFHVVTLDLPGLAAFYRDVLGFGIVGDIKPIEREEMRLLGLQGGGRRLVLSLGSQTVAIDQFEMAGRSYPPNSDAASLSFQHLALVVVDIAEAYAGLGDIAPISIDRPQQLPASSGGAQAFKFRDPDGHPFELIQFSRANMPAIWKDKAALPGEIALGIDHSAISVHDADTSVAFYADLGLKQGKRTFNLGPAQQRLDDLKNVEVSVVPMIPETAAPHLELLAYQASKGDSIPPRRANDVAATRILWRGDKAELLSDPDGHLQQIEP